jgi:prophage regulatory protein
MTKIIRYAELRTEKGIPFSRAHLLRLEAAGKFPQRVRYAEGGEFFGWLESEIDDHIAERAARRHTKEGAV